MSVLCANSVPPCPGMSVSRHSAICVLCPFHTFCQSGQTRSIRTLPVSNLRCRNHMLPLSTIRYVRFAGKVFRYVRNVAAFAPEDAYISGHVQNVRFVCCVLFVRFVPSPGFTRTRVTNELNLHRFWHPRDSTSGSAQRSNYDAKKPSPIFGR